MTNWALQNFGRIDFKPEEFERAIYQKGARITWEKSILCSCIDRKSGAPDFTCMSCEGKGFVYFDPKPIRAAVSSLGRDDSPMSLGVVDVGTAYVTTMSTDAVNFRDRLTFEDFRVGYSTVLRYDGEPVKLKYEVEEIISVMVLSHQLSEDDYSVSPGMDEIILRDGLLSKGENFSVLVSVKPRYIVIDMPHELRGTFVQFGQPSEKWTILPKQLLIKREDLLPLKRGEVL